MRNVAAGRKNQKISIYKPMTGKSASGAPMRDKFQLITSPWASVITKQLFEQEAGDSHQSKIAYSIVIGWRDIAPNWVLLWRKQLLKITSVDDSDPTRRQKILIATSDNGISEADFLESSISDELA
jgi:head-tail adaptor